MSKVTCQGKHFCDPVLYIFDDVYDQVIYIVLSWHILLQLLLLLLLLGFVSDTHVRYILYILKSHGTWWLI